MRLNTLALPLLKAASPPLVSVPAYDPSELQAGIVHVGVGNFHRAHMAYYIDELLNQNPNDKDALKWGIVGSGIVTNPNEKQRKWLEPQDWLQTIVERDGETCKARIIAPMVDFLDIDDQDSYGNSALEEALLNPNIKIVSMTVTEGGYFLDQQGKFDPENPKIKAEAASPDSPKTLFGVIVKALKKRKEAGRPPFTVQTCDNIPHNGDVVRGVVVGLAQMTDPKLAAWIDDNVSFPNSMVDRITPATSDLEREYVVREFGYEDAWPVFCEPFCQWILEDDFKHGRPALERLPGVKFVPDVAPYEKMKIRILNGGHAAMCYPSALLGVKYVHEAMEHPVIRPFLDALEKDEIIPTVPPVPDTSLTEYWDLIAKRFSNPTINDTIIRNCYDGASRQPKFIIPVALDGVRKGGKIDGLALVSAMWCRYCQGATESGEPIEPNDPIWDRLHATAKEAASDPSKWLAMKDIYGEVGQDATFIKSFTSALNTIQDAGVETAMMKYANVGQTA
jgi:mannitol 2-dehydrogenase